MNKKWVSVLSIGGSVAISAAIITPVAITISNNQQKQLTKYDHDKPFAYNDVMHNFSETANTNNDDSTMKQFYDAVTLPLIIEQPSANNINVKTITLGTMWSFDPSWIGLENSELRTYFATNIHVVNKILVSAGNKVNIKAEGVDNIHVFTRFDGTGQETSKPYNKVELTDIRLEKISLTSAYEKTLNTNRMNYSDFVILSCSNQDGSIFNKDALSKLVINPIDESNEFQTAVNGIINNPEQYPLYIAGFPSKPNNYTEDYYNYVTVKYIHNNLNVKTSTTYLQVGSDNYYKDQNGIKIFSNSADVYHSFSHQLIMPELVIPGGSSGSLVSIIKNGVIMPLGIWWGQYTSVYNPIQYGVLDFFYTDDYYLVNNREKVRGYNLFNLNQ